MIYYEVHYGRLRGGQCLSGQRVGEVANAVAQELKIRAKKNISVAFVSPTQIRAHNRDYRGMDRATDVLSFGEGGEGEVLVCYDQAKKQAQRMGHGIKQELVFLIVHGTLHLFGFDHESAKDQEKMFAHQTSILKKLKVPHEVYYD